MTCMECCQEFIDHVYTTRQAPAGVERKAFPHRLECERPDCALFDMMLEQIKCSGMPELAAVLGRLRGKFTGERVQP